MLKPILFVTVAFALVVASTPNARAAMCFQYTKSGGGVSVAQADLPQPNKCITFGALRGRDYARPYRIGCWYRLALQKYPKQFCCLPLHVRRLHPLRQIQLLRVWDLPTGAKPGPRLSHGVQRLSGGGHRGRSRSGWQSGQFH